MIFNSFNFIVLFPLIFLLYYAIPAKYQKARNLCLLAVSYALYINWKPVYAFILLGITIVTYFTARYIERAKNKKPIMVAGIIVSLLPLLFFKYFNFINETVYDLLSLIGLRFQLVGLNWAIPIGISFFTFQALSYVWDVYYKKIDAEHDFLIYALFVSFFPSIVAGPINRASLMIPQLKNLRPYFDYPKAVQGLKLLLWGMFMKVVVADRVALYVDTVLSQYMNYTGLSCFVASILYTVQIYADFGGYSLMAIGVGKTLGFDLTTNFRRPFFAHSVSDYWTRWHLSFSSWLRDYIYIPLGGSRKGKYRTYLNVFITLLVSGIWHGANWTFILWGAWHAICIILERIFNQQKCRYGVVGRTIKILITFMLINFSRILFHMPTISDAYNVMIRIFDFSLPMTLYNPNRTNIALYVIGIGLLFGKDFLDEYYPNRHKFFDNRRKLVRWSSYLAIFVLIILMGVLGADQFIYANF